MSKEQEIEKQINDLWGYQTPDFLSFCLFHKPLTDCEKDNVSTKFKTDKIEVLKKRIIESPIYYFLDILNPSKLKLSVRIGGEDFYACQIGQDDNPKKIVIKENIFFNL